MDTTLLFTCPNTGWRAPSGISTDVQTLGELWSRRVKVNCSCCGEVHEISIREEYIESVLDDANVWWPRRV
jgi:hypothetical protein